MAERADAIHEVARAVDAARSVAVVTGAGVSAESDIPTFRESMSGLWAEFDPQQLATPEAFAADPERVTRWYDHRRLGCLAAEPNPGHLALAEIERRVTARGGSFMLLTQNVDGLHQRGGSERVVEVHGSLMRWRCMATGQECEPPPEPFERFPPPSPFDAGNVLRPGVVWFGEMLPGAALDAADRAIATADIFFSVGTSTVVYPAAGFVQAAGSRGASTVEVNPEPTPISDEVTWSLRGPSGEILPKIVAAMDD
ncbi:MAG: NAD-dependent deacylase [Planctomycetota bacterium]